MLSTIIFTLIAVSPFLCVQARNQTSSATSTTSALPTSSGNIPPCVLNCTTTAATQAGCAGIADLTCVCTSQKFQATAGACVQAQCSASDQAVANELHNTTCVSVTSTSGSTPASGSTTASGSNTTSVAGSRSVTAAASAASSGSSVTSSASGLHMGLGTGYVIGFVAVLAGIIAGTSV